MIRLTSQQVPFSYVYFWLINLSDIDKRVCNEQRSTGVALHGPINITCIPFLIFVLQVAFRQLVEGEEVPAAGRHQLTTAESSANASVVSVERRVRGTYGWLYHLLVAVASYQTLTDNVFFRGGGVKA